MSTVRELLDRLAAIGATVEPAGDHLVLRAGATAVPATLVTHLRQAKAEVLIALATVESERPEVAASDVRAVGDATDWRAFFAERVAIRQYEAGYPRSQAERLAWGDTINAWHMACGERAPAWRCAGCCKPISGAEALTLPDGTRVHFAGLDCLTRYGAKWRAAASRVLVAMGLKAAMEAFNL